ncbi:MAG: transketolase [Planctomycetaceae bacterium]|nr:transketolase [Planctomycetaceae bacterium]
MRTAFIEQLIVEARKKPKLFLVVGDLGFSVVEPFAAEFPDRFLNAGVAEQNMTGVAAGLASEGYHVFTYSIGNFPTLRCLEQIRNDICYHNLPVTVVAVGAGMAYGNLGYSHHCVHDIGALRGLPGITILSPADPGETRQCVSWLSENPGPSYLRLGKAGEPTIHHQPVNLDSPTCIAECGGEVAIVGTGSILSEAIEASKLLAKRGIMVDVFSLTNLTPTCKDYFTPLHKFTRILTVEEHVTAGGIGEMLGSVLDRRTQVRSITIPQSFCSVVGSQKMLRTASKLSASEFAQTIVDWGSNERQQ